jgi:murein DD-endopeptidase MepM/ murein hydrolase activator NlpD
MNNPTPATAGRKAIVWRASAVVGRASARSRPALGRIVCLLALLNICVLALVVVLAIAPVARASARATDPQWSWPLAGSPTIVRGFEPPPEPWVAGHRGVDLLAAPGEPVLAAGAGRVTFAGWVGGIPAVTVLHPDGRRTTYQPVLATVVRGHQVARGAILGLVSAGGSHCLPRACLHWGLRLGSSYLDPLSLVGRDIEVRLLPLWSALPASALPASALPASALPTSALPASALPTSALPTSASAQPASAQQTAIAATSRMRADLARLGALNRARAVRRSMT